MHLGDVSPLVIHDHRYVDMQTQNSCWQCGDVVECEGAAGPLSDAEIQGQILRNSILITLSLGGFRDFE